MHRSHSCGEGRVSRLGLPHAVTRAATALVLIACLGACGQAKATKYGHIPSFLPKAKHPVDRIVDASAKKAALSVQGETVSVALKHGRVLATVVGPVVPPFRAPPPPTVTATFTISLARAAGEVPVAIKDFTIRDQLGRVVHPQLATGEARPPSSVRPGGHVAFQLTAVLPTGEGVIRWAPGGSPSPLVAWDFVVEDD